jgi:F-type H+-transporting ATPase subunit epsilon
MKLSIVTPENELIAAEEAKRVTIPTTAGEITVLPGHAPVITILSPGELIVEYDRETRPLAVSGGIVEITKKYVKILADSAESVTELDIDRAEEAKKRAEELLKNRDKMDVDFANIAAKLEKELVRIKVGKKYRNVGGPRQ